jgi:hypothetical protein
MKRLANSLLFLLSLISSGVTIAFAWLELGKNASSEGKLAILILASFVVALFVFTTSREFTYSRKARYAESLGHLGRAFATLQALACDPDATDAHIELGCSTVCTDVAQAMELISATQCSVCIKALKNADAGSNDVRLEIVTLSRDKDSASREVSTRSHPHYLDQNTDFTHIHERLGTPTGYFLSHYLPSVPGYRNSSFAAYGRPVDIPIPIIGAIVRDLRWPLPYRSTIVVPISTEQSTATYGKLVGYLCVDSRARSAFRRRYDVEVLFAMANCLYEVVGRYWELRWGAI